MAHINIYAEDLENVRVSVVEKKGYTGVKVESINERTGDPYQAITLWGFTRERLITDLEFILSVAQAKNSVPELKLTGTLGE